MIIKDRRLRLWYQSHMGGIKRELTEEECSIIMAYDDCMNQLVPTDKLLRIVGGYDNIMNANIKKLSKKFGVFDEVILCKMDDLIRKHNIEIKKDMIKKKILKKEDNIITVNFN